MRLCAVVQLIDGFSQAPAEDVHPRFLLNQEPYRPQAKPQGFYAFSELADGDYRLTTIALPFFPREVDFKVPLSLPLAEAIVPCVLEPSPLYPFPAGTTLIRGQVVSAATHAPLAGVTVQASYQNWRGDPRQATTRTSDFGQYNGRYALAPRGRLAPRTEVTLTFSKTDYATAQTQLVLEAGTTQLVNIELDLD
ncbi:carboxypeptidase regulatory-like domain-containing protein [Trinickia fusca]|uniref:Carboxypeptidase regulatory-like domain-containing protein n=1 Tax=Trinickia fusca TaxID=2419777 RepID=A0A494X8F5_9BURK|nr:carboxypeptidase regulatory-like domain-containing protein [Trinickia fusca]RKP46838.1 carboxypeptidase regulatory-like domain-containing protein [Trinickia fusca]